MRTPFYRDIKSQNELEIYYDQIKQILSRFNYEVEEIGFIPNNKAEFHKTILLEEKPKFIQKSMDIGYEKETAEQAVIKNLMRFFVKIENTAVLLFIYFF